MGVSITEARSDEAIVKELDRPGRTPLLKRLKPDWALPPELYPTPAAYPVAEASPASPSQIRGVPAIPPATTEGTAKRYKDWRGLIQHFLDKLPRMVNEAIAFFCNDLVKKFQENAEIASELTAAFNAAGYDLVRRPALDAPVSTLPLPDKAPRLWANRDAGTNAAQFIRKEYAPWIEAGVLTAVAVKACDKALYQAYNVWKHRHPSEAPIPFAAGNPHGKLDDAEAGRRHRAGIKAAQSKAKARASLCGIMSHPV